MPDQSLSLHHLLGQLKPVFCWDSRDYGDVKNVTPFSGYRHDRSDAVRFEDRDDHRITRLEPVLSYGLDPLGVVPLRSARNILLGSSSFYFQRVGTV